MPSKSKNKGNRGETELAALLSSIFDGHFARVPNSGAMIGGKNNVRKATLSDTQNRIYRGDLIPPDHMLGFVCESKNYAEFRFHQLMTPGPCPQLDEWIGQTLDCVEPGDAWFVCFKIVRTAWFVAVPELGQGYVYGNSCRYAGRHGSVQVTELTGFFRENKDRVMWCSSRSTR